MISDKMIFAKKYDTNIEMKSDLIMPIFNAKYIFFNNFRFNKSKSTIAISNSDIDKIKCFPIC